MFQIKRPDEGANVMVLDGMTIDVDGNLYIGTWGGRRVYKVDPMYVTFFCQLCWYIHQIVNLCFTFVKNDETSSRLPIFSEH